MHTADATRAWVGQIFEQSIVPTLVDYIKIPNKSPMFDPQWREHGHMMAATELLACGPRSG